MSSAAAIHARATCRRAPSGRSSRPACTRCWRACSPARGVRSADELDDGAGAAAAAVRPARRAEAAARCSPTRSTRGQRICVVADYDCDGATACAVALRGLAMLGARARHAALRRARPRVHGYGLTPAIVDLALRAARPTCWSRSTTASPASPASRTRARAASPCWSPTTTCRRCVDDAVVLPDADVIVNPNQPGCGFESKAPGRRRRDVLRAAGAARRAARARRASTPRRSRGSMRCSTWSRSAPWPTSCRLDANNRRLVAQGLKRIRAGRMQPGIAALFAAAGRDARARQRASTSASRSGRASTPPAAWPT